MELGRGYIWVGRGGLINVALCDCRSEYKRNCYLWMPTGHLASLLPCPACVHMLGDHSTGAQPGSKGCTLV